MSVPGLQMLPALPAPFEVVRGAGRVQRVSKERLRVYAHLAAAGSRCALYARDLPAYVAPGVAGVAVTDDTPLVDLWAVLLQHPSGSVALTAPATCTSRICWNPTAPSRPW